MRHIVPPPRLGLLGIGVLFSTTLAGCFSTATLHTARPVAAGEVQGGVALGSYVGEDDGDLSVFPTLEAQVRTGLSGSVDAGAHLTSFGGLALDVNWALLQTDEQALAIDPTIEFSIGTYAWLPVLWDFYTTEELTLTAAVRGGRYWLDLDNNDEDALFDSIEADAWLWGAGLGARIRISDVAAFAPEVRLTWIDPEGGSRGDAIVSVSLGMVF